MSENPTVIRSKYEEANRLLHTLWTKSVGKEDYSKSEWQRLEALITQLTRHALVGAGVPGDRLLLVNETSPTKKDFPGTAQCLLCKKYGLKVDQQTGKVEEHEIVESMGTAHGQLYSLIRVRCPGSDAVCSEWSKTG